MFNSDLFSDSVRLGVKETILSNSDLIFSLLFCSEAI